MQHRNVLSLIGRCALVCLGCLVLAPPALAESDEPVSLLSRLLDSLPNPGLTLPGLTPALPDPGLSLPSPTPALPDPGLALPAEELAIHELTPFPPISDAIDLTMRPDDLWVRIRNGFAMTNLNDDLVLYYQQWYQNRPDALRRMVERSRPYLHHIVEELEARGMPTELAFLPMVESSFNPMAYSRAHASGLWQFIPATGKRFKLEQNWWQDQRRDIVASTGAALDYLQTIYEMNGDWHLALASYNWGEGAVKRAMEKNLARGLPTDFASLTMPAETRHYVPKLQALKNIFANPALMLQLGLPEIINRPYFATVEMGRPVDVKTAARLANMPLQEFMALNPSHNRPVIKGYTPMVIPTEKLQTFQDNLESNTAPLTAWQSYTLKSGEKLDKLAPRFGITLADLMRVNGLQGKLRLSTGTTLLVPTGKGGADLDDLPMTPMLPMLPRIVVPEPVHAPSRLAAKAKNGSKDKPAKGGKAKTLAKQSPVKAGANGAVASKAGKAAVRPKVKAVDAKTSHKTVAKEAGKDAGKAPAKVPKAR